MFLVPPIMFGHPLTTIAMEGENVIFTCQFHGSPFPVSRVHWLRNRLFITDKMPSPRLNDAGYSDQTRVWNYEHNSTLIIKQVDLADSGEYVCEVTTLGFQPVRSQPAQLIVKGILVFSYFI